MQRETAGNILGGSYTQDGRGRRTRLNPNRENTLHKDILKPRVGLVFWQGRADAGHSQLPCKFNAYNDT